MRGLDEWQWQRVDAYPGWEGTRDVGAGVDIVGWLAEVEQRADDIRSEGPTDSDAGPAAMSHSLQADDEALYVDVMAELDGGTHVGNLDAGLVSRARTFAERRGLRQPPGVDDASST